MVGYAAPKPSTKGQPAWIVEIKALCINIAAASSLAEDELSGLYASRWNVELDLRKLKTTTGMGVLSSQTPQMNEQQLWVHLLAYNVIRLLMAQAACNAELDPRASITLAFQTRLRFAPGCQAQPRSCAAA